VRVDIHPCSVLNRHFIVAEQMTLNRRGLFIADPWGGTCTRLLERYAPANGHWDLNRALYGA
jgi:hypothetical protein